MSNQQVKVGLDLGAHSLKWAVLDSQRQPLRFFTAEVLADRESQNDQPHPRWLAARLGEIMDECRAASDGVWSDRVRAGLQGEGVVCGYLELPAVGPEGLEKAVPAALQEQLPFNVNDVGLRFLEVPPYQKQPGKQAVFYGTYLKTMAQQRRRLLESCGLEVEELEVSTLAMAREFRINREPHEENNFWAVVHVGFDSSHVLVTRNGFPYYSRDFEIAGKSFTYAFQIGYQTTWAKAEQYKLNYRVATKDFQIEPFLLDFTDEIKRSLGHFGKRFPAARVSRLFLSGGTALWHGLDRRIEEALGIPVTQDGWEGLKPPGGADPVPEASVYKVALGLALS